MRQAPTPALLLARAAGSALTRRRRSKGRSAAYADNCSRKLSVSSAIIVFIRCRGHIDLVHTPPLRLQLLALGAHRPKINFLIFLGWTIGQQRKLNRRFPLRWFPVQRATKPLRARHRTAKALWRLKTVCCCTPKVRGQRSTPYKRYLF